ncbi:hypothetical protein [Blautia stercoris]
MKENYFCGKIKSSQEVDFTMNYSPELKDALLRRMLPPNNESITKISREEGYAAPGTDAIPDNWSTQDKFLIVVETASMNANGGIAKEVSRLNRELKDSEKERRKLEKELQRKEKALAEAEALLVLSKKANAIWGESENE